MFVTCQVFGKLAGTQAAHYALSRPLSGITDAEAMRQCEEILANASKKADVGELAAFLKRSAQNNLLIRRSKQGLDALLDDIGAIEKALEAAPAAEALSPALLGLLGLLFSARMMARFALLRRETRGSHFRADYPAQNDAEFGVPQVLSVDF
jgi:succinate dehydrogenase/fumarate reductase flavoprotein subunit